MILAAVLAVTLAADDHRPLAELASQLEKQYPVVITYEESAAPRKTAVTFNYAEGTPYRELVEMLVKQAQDAGAPGEFRVEGHDAIFHIFPAGESLLSAPVTLEDKERTVDDTLDEIVAQLPAPMSWGFVPLNLFVQTKVRIAAKDEPARAVFRRILEQVAAQKPYYRVTWRLYRDATLDRSVLSFLITASEFEEWRP